MCSYSCRNQEEPITAITTKKFKMGDEDDIAFVYDFISCRNILNILSITLPNCTA